MGGSTGRQHEKRETTRDKAGAKDTERTGVGVGNGHRDRSGGGPRPRNRDGRGFILRVYILTYQPGLRG